MRPINLPIRGCHPLWLIFPDHSGQSHGSAGPRSLATTGGVSVDFLSSGYLDVSVPRVRSCDPMYSGPSPWFIRLVTSVDVNNRMSGGFPHSEIHGSKPIPGSPWLIAGYHVLHRLLLPRHPPNALIALDSIRKKKDLMGPNSGRKQVHFPSPACRKGTFWLVYLTWTTPPLTPSGTIAPTLGCDRQRVSLSERCKAQSRCATSDWTSRHTTQGCSC